jgi:hypothetical protein
MFNVYRKDSGNREQGTGNGEQGTGNREHKRKMFFILYSELLNS